MSLSNVKNHLNNLSKSKLIGIISELYNKFDNVKEYHEYFFNPQEDKLLEKYSFAEIIKAALKFEDLFEFKNENIILIYNIS